MLTSSQTSQFMRMNELQNSASYNQGTLASQKPKLKIYERFDSEIIDQSTKMSFQTQESLPAAQLPPSLAVDPTDFDVVSEKQAVAPKKTLNKAAERKFKSMVVASTKLELTKRLPCSKDSDILEPFQD